MMSCLRDFNKRRRMESNDHSLREGGEDILLHIAKNGLYLPCTRVRLASVNKRLHKTITPDSIATAQTLIMNGDVYSLARRGLMSSRSWISDVVRSGYHELLEFSKAMREEFCDTYRNLVYVHPDLHRVMYVYGKSRLTYLEKLGYMIGSIGDRDIIIKHLNSLSNGDLTDLIRGLCVHGHIDVLDELMISFQSIPYQMIPRSGTSSPEGAKMILLKGSNLGEMRPKGNKPAKDGGWTSQKKTSNIKWSISDPRTTFGSIIVSNVFACGDISKIKSVLKRASERDIRFANPFPTIFYNSTPEIVDLALRYFIPSPRCTNDIRIDYVINPAGLVHYLTSRELESSYLTYTSNTEFLFQLLAMPSSVNRSVKLTYMRCMNLDLAKIIMGAKIRGLDPSTDFDVLKEWKTTNPDNLTQILRYFNLILWKSLSHSDITTTENLIKDMCRWLGYGGNFTDRKDQGLKEIMDLLNTSDISPIDIRADRNQLDIVRYIKGGMFSELDDMRRYGKNRSFRPETPPHKGSVIYGILR